MIPHSLPIRALQAAVVAVIASFALAACGSSIDVPSVEKNIKSGLPDLVKENNVDSDLAVTSVSCPKNPDASAGSEFDCDFTLEDESEGAVTAKVGDSDVDYQVKRYAAGHLSDDIAAFYAKAQDLKITTECPDPVKDGMVCDFEDEDGATGQITVAVTDEGFEYDPAYD